MKIYEIKSLTIDLVKERNRIATADFSPPERKKLHQLVTLFEAGKFTDAIVYTSKWSREMKEYIDPEIWGVLWNVNTESASYYLPSQ